MVVRMLSRPLPWVLLGACLAGILVLTAWGSDGKAGSKAGPPRGGDDFAVASISKGVQYVSASISAEGYPRIVVQKGLPLRWTLLVRAEDLNPCTETLVIPRMGLRRTLVPGRNLLSFTPDRAGTMIYSCSMGMIAARIEVLEDLSNSVALDLLRAAPAGLAPGGGSGLPAIGPVPTESIGMAAAASGGQRVTLRLGRQGFKPALLVLQRGLPASISFEPEPGLAEEDAIVEFPGHDIRLDLRSKAGTAELGGQFGDFTFRTGSGSFHGYVSVADDPGSVDRAALREFVAAYHPAGEGPAPCCGY